MEASIDYPLACKIGLTSLALSMLNKGADPLPGLIHASEAGHDQIVSLILGRIDPGDTQEELRSALAVAEKWKRDECVALLVRVIESPR